MFNRGPFRPGTKNMPGGSPTIRYGQTSPGEGWVYQGQTRNPSTPPKMGWQTTGYWTQAAPTPAPAAAPPPKQEQPTQSAPSGPRNPENYPPIDYTPQVQDQNWTAAPDINITMPDPMMTIGGASSSLDSGATGFRRKRSSARLAGLTNKGTSSLKITGQSARSSGLNIG